MIKAIRFQNYKVLRDTTLPLGSFTLLIGPNGSGKSTAISAIRNAPRLELRVSSDLLASAGATSQEVTLTLQWGPPLDGVVFTARWGPQGPMSAQVSGARSSEIQQAILNDLNRARVYSFEAGQLAAVVQPQPSMTLGERGEGLAGVLDRLRDQHPERFEALNAELSRWLPEFDSVLFDTVQPGGKAIFLRTRPAKHRFPAWNLSQGTLLALGIL